MERNRQVAEYFTEESASWNAKYAAGGSMSGRRSAFRTEVERVVVSGMVVCDLGCGTGALIEAVADLGVQLVGADIAEGMLRQASRRTSCAGILVQVSGELAVGLPFHNSAFQVVLSSSVLEYVWDLPGYIGEVHRIISVGGYWIVTVPDTRHWSRFIERIEWMCYKVFPSVAEHISPMRSRYLKMSVNRMTEGTWSTLLCGSGFRVQRVSRELSGLLLFTLQKDANE